MNLKKKGIVIGIFVTVVIALVVAVIVAGYITNSSKQTPYEHLRDNGYTGTEQELFDSLLKEEKLAGDSEYIKTAYDEATEKGYKGSKNEWLETLGANKNNVNAYGGDNSMYDMAVQNGFSGTPEEWVESLKEPTIEREKNKEDKKEVTDSQTKSSMADTTSAPVDDILDVLETAPKPAEDEFTVIFRNYDGSVLKTQNVVKGEEATPPSTPEREEYVFICWDKTFDDIQNNTIVNAVFEKITKPTIIVDRVDVKSDSKIAEVKVAVKNNPGISSLNLKVDYDESLIFKKVEYNNDLKGQSMKPGQEEGPVTLTWVSPFEDVNGDWTFATLYFDIAEDATGDLPVNITYNTENIYNMKEENVCFDVVNGAVAITE